MFLGSARLRLLDFLRTGLRQKELNAIQDIGENERFTEEGVASRLQRLNHQSWVGRDDEDCSPLRSFDLTQPLHDLEPVHFRHLEIQEDEVVVILEVQRLDLFRVRRRRNIGISATPKRVFEQTDVRHLVIDDEDPDNRTVS